MDTRHFTNARCPLPCSIDDSFSLDVAVVRDDPGNLPCRRNHDTADQHFGVDFNTHVSGLARELKGNAAGIYVSVIRHVYGTVKAARVQLGASFQNFRGRYDIGGQADGFGATDLPLQGF